MNGIKGIFGKEFARIFKDKKMIFSLFLLPPLVMIVIMGLVNFMSKQMEDDIESHTPIVYLENAPASFQEFLKAGDYDFDLKEAARGEVEDMILNGKADLLIEFPVGFDKVIEGYQLGDPVPQIKTFYNPSEDYSDQANTKISGQVLEAYRQTLLSARVGNLDQLAVFTVNTDNDAMVIQDEDKAAGKALGTMLPYFITVLLFAGAMAIGTDMIAGEKERGTMASLLMTPTKRSSIALGKVFALMCLSGMSSVVSVVAMVGGMPLMSRAMTGQSSEGLNISFTFEQILMIAGLLIAVSFLFAAIIALLSVFAKSVKEASSYVMPVYMLVLMIGLMTMFQTGETAMNSFFIPIYNTAIVLKGILAQEITMAQYGITLGITVVISVVLIGAIVKAFESEKVMSA